MSEVTSNVHMVTSPAWDIFEAEQMDYSTVEKEFIEYRETNVTNTAGLTKYEIETRDKDSFILPHEGYLEVRYRVCTDTNGTVIPPTDKIALQNSALSLFKNVDYLIEDQRIEYQDDPFIGCHIKNISDFSRQFGQSISSNEHYYLDTTDKPSIPNHNIRFYINTGVRSGNEIFFIEDGATLFSIDTARSGIESATTWLRLDRVVAFIGEFPTPGTEVSDGAGANVNLYMRQYSNAVIFQLSTLAVFNTKTEITFTLSNDANGNLVPSAGAATNSIEAYVVGTGQNIQWFKAIPAGFVAGPLPSPPQKMTLTVAAGPLLATLPAGAAGYYLYGGIPNKDYYNDGFYKRYAQTIKYSISNVAASFAGTTSIGLVSAWIPLKHIFQFCRAYNKISRGLRHRIVLNKNADNDALLKYGNHADRFLRVEYISCWIPRLKPDLQTLRIIEEKLVSNDSYNKVAFTDLTTWHSNKQLSSSGNQVSFQLATTTKKIIRCWVAFQLATRYEGGQRANKRVFDNMLVSAIQARLNGSIFPMYEYKFDVTNGDFKYYNRAYTALMNAGYKMVDDMDGSMITYEQFKNLYPIYYFDMTNQPEDLFKSAKYSELEVRFTNNLAKDYYVWIVYESERELTIKGVNGSMVISL